MGRIKQWVVILQFSTNQNRNSGYAENLTQMRDIPTHWTQFAVVYAVNLVVMKADNLSERIDAFY